MYFGGFFIFIKCREIIHAQYGFTKYKSFKIFNHNSSIQSCVSLLFELKFIGIFPPKLTNYLGVGQTY